MCIRDRTDALQADCAKLEADLVAIPVGSIKAMNYYIMSTGRICYVKRKRLFRMSM